MMITPSHGKLLPCACLTFLAILASPTNGEALPEPRAQAAAALVRGEPDRARQILAAALLKTTDPGEARERALILDQLGFVHQRLGDLDKARGTFEQALVLFREQGERLLGLKCQNNLCAVRLRQGDWQEAKVCFEDVLAESRGLGEARLESDVLVSLGGVYVNLGEPESALESFRRTLELSRALKDPLREAQTRNNLGALFRRLGQADEALAEYHAALALFRRLEDHHWVARTLNNLGYAHLSLGELDLAEELLREALPLRRQVGDPPGEAATLRNLGRWAALRGDAEAALGFQTQALALARDMGHRRGESIALLLLGAVLVERGEPAAALPHLEAALRIRRELGNRPGLAPVEKEMGVAWLALGEPAAADGHLEEALLHYRSFQDPVGEAETLYALARVDRHAGRLAASREHLQTALGVVESLRVEIDDPLRRASFLAARRGVYELLVDLFMELHEAQSGAGWERAALEVSEMARARTLLDFLDGLEESDESRAHAVSRVKNADAVMALLRPGEVLLHYTLGEERSFLWMITRSLIDSRELPARARLEALARETHRQLSLYDQRRGATSRAAGRELASLILPPELGRLRGERLLVVPDGALGYVPFATLPWPPSSTESASAERGWVLDRWEVAHLPSTSVLGLHRQLRKARGTASKTLAIFADPVFHTRDPRLRPHPEPRPREESVGRGRTFLERSAQEMGISDLDRLPHTRTEALAIAELTPAEKTFVALGLEADRKTALSGQLGDFEILHFATHGLVHPQRPELSGIVLSQVDESGRPREGFLSLHDLAGLELAADLVVLSGCRTGLGKEILGEGFVGLSRGFLYAGVPQVVASLWQVQDEATSVLMERFYRSLLVEGKSPAAALRTAQLALRADRRWRDPFFWGAFTVLGDTR